MISLFSIQVKRNIKCGQSPCFLINVFLILLFFCVCIKAYTLGGSEKRSLSFQWAILYENEYKIPEAIDPSIEDIFLPGGTIVNFFIDKQNSSAYVYLLHFDSEGNFNILFPVVFEKRAFQKANGPGSFQLLDEGIEEYFYILASIDRITNLENNIRSWQKEKKTDKRMFILYKIKEIADGFLKRNSPLLTGSEQYEYYGGTFRSDLRVILVSEATQYARKIRIKH